jgi:carotenoid cleavage dioxygenase-like enzyme
MRIIFFLYLLSISNAFLLKLPFFKGFSISEKEIRKNIQYNLPKNQRNIINKINGFYGLIGPDVNITEVKTVYDLFTGDGIIQGIFFDKGELTFIKHMVRTDKLNYEMENGRIPNHNFIKLLFSIGYKLNVLPNILGLANTAFMNIGKKYYALYERDVPYEIDIDFNEKTVSTIKKIKLPEIENFSAHTKVSNIIETIDYNVFTNKVSYYQLNENLEELMKKDIKMEYMPIVHDILSSPTKVVLLDSPINIDMNNLLNKPMPVLLNEKKRTLINILNKKDFSIERFSINEGFYIFHYADYKETDTLIEIYASHYDKLDFSDLDIKGKYRKLIINKVTKEVSIIKNRELEKINIEFPIKFGDKVVLRNIENKQSTGFIICKELEIIKRIDFENRTICGEPAIEYIENKPFLIAFAFNSYEKDKSYLLVINMNSYEKIEIDLPVSMTIGFHSVFYKSTLSTLKQNPLLSFIEEMRNIFILFTIDMPLFLSL